MDASTYDVVLSGELIEGFDAQQVVAALAALFKISEEKSQTLVGSQRTIKKGLDEKTAALYQQKLRNIGLEVNTVAQPVEAPAFGLSLEPIEPRAQETEEAPPPAANTVASMNVSPAETAPATATARDESDENDAGSETDSFSDDLTPKSMAAVAGAALVGAILWSMIASLTGYEFGLLAWAIGGAVGFAAVATGSVGDRTAMFCAALALASILGGRYMVVSTMKDDLLSGMQSPEMAESYQFAYDEYMAAAAAYAETYSEEDAIRSFMIDHGYTEAYEPADISASELAAFETEAGTQLEQAHYAQPTFEEWQRDVLGEAFSSISNWELMKESFGFIDLLFLFLGISTAYKLGRSGTQT